MRASFVPPEPIRQLRDLTRARTAITRERGREVQRVEKLLEDAGIKLSAVASDIMGVSGRLMLQALIAGQHDPAVLADLAKRRLRSKIPELTEALTGRFTEHHAFLARVHLDLIDRHTEALDQLTARIEVMMEPFQGFRDLICTIPGIGTLTADVVIAETGADMTRFPSAKHLGSWAGTTPGNNESAGRVKSSKTRPGSPYLQGALGAAAMACSQNPRTYLGARYRRIATRRGPQKANVAIQHSMLIAIWRYAPGVAFERITTDPDVMGGMPTVRGLRITVATVVAMVADGMTAAEIVDDLPDLTVEDVAEALRYAAEAVRERELPLAHSG